MTVRRAVVAAIGALAVLCLVLPDDGEPRPITQVDCDTWSIETYVESVRNSTECAP